MGIIISVTEVGPRGPAVDAAFYNGKGEAERGFVQPLSTNVTWRSTWPFLRTLGAEPLKATPNNVSM